MTSRTNVFMFSSFALAMILGIFAQGIAYFINDFIYQTLPIYYVTFLTGLSIVLFVFVVMVLFIQFSRGKIEAKHFSWCAPTFIGICFLTSCWSLFVVIMWWG